MRLTEITENDISRIALGAAVLGTGGGGDPYVGALIARRLIRLHGPVTVRQLSDLSDDDFVVPVGMIGAPSVAIEKIMSENELSQVLAGVETAFGQKPDVLMPIEVGGGNSLIPIAAAALSGLPILDADAMGRAFPEAQMVTFHLAGYGPGTTVLVDAQGNQVISHPVDGIWSERLARSLTIQMGGSATMVDYAYSGRVVRECALPGTLGQAHRIGNILLSTEIHDDERIARLLSELGGFRIFDGKVAEIDRYIECGFTRGRADLQGTGEDQGSTCELSFQNEMLLARRNSELAAVTPDLIAVLDAGTGYPITTETLRYGARVTLVAFPCNEKWRTPIGLDTVGPSYFGYDVEYCPVETLAAQTLVGQMLGPLEPFAAEQSVTDGLGVGRSL